jgi:hypothetical protein
VRAELAKQGVTDAELAAITADYDARIVRAQAEAAGPTSGE